MPEKDPTTYTLVTYGWVVVLSGWAGVASYIRKVRAGVVRTFSIAELIGEIVIASLSGVMTFWLCEFAEVDPLLAAVLIAISGHMGTRAIIVSERIFEAWLDRVLDRFLPPEDRGRPRPRQPDRDRAD